MVKLRVVVRVLLETEYLTHLDSGARTSIPIPGEKRFHVVVQDPESWYIGTLAVAVRQKYQNLYKHDLGQIKYLKYDDDDCDLDPEEGVSDLLVDEGRAQTDRSDQHVTIKVIREQGRAVREGSVIPDLTPVRYQLPTKPPVPRFDQLETTLGKRTADDSDENEQASKRRRSRLSEIEEEHDVVATIENNHSTDQVIENSQPTQTMPDGINGATFEDEDSTIAKWSFSQLGPPTAIEKTVPTMTPVRTAATNSRSPSVRDSGFHMRFLKPPRDVFAYPESDIDDSQNSAGTHRSPKITPRLVPSRDKSQSAKPHSSNDRNNLSATLTAAVSPMVNQGEKRKRTTSVHGDDESSPTQPENDLEATAADGVTLSENVEAPNIIAAGVEHGISKEDAVHNNHAQPVPNKTTQSSEAGQRANDATGSTVIDTLNNAKSRAAVADSAAQLSRKPRASAAEDSSVKKVPPAKTKQTPRNASQSQATSASTEQDASSSSKTGPRAKSRGRGISTPPPDSPSEQLSQALQESARKSMSTKSISNEDLNQSTPKPKKSTKRNAKSDAGEKRLGLGITDSPRKAKDDKHKSPDSPKNTTAKGPSESGQDTAEPDQDLLKKTRKRRSRKSAAQDLEQNDPTVPIGAVTTKPTAIAREKSTESNSNRTTGVILPPGMTHAEYDSFIASHSNLETKKSVRKRGSTPSLVKSVSKDSQPEITGPARETTTKSFGSARPSSSAAGEKDSLTITPVASKTSVKVINTAKPKEPLSKKESSTKSSFARQESSEAEADGSSDNSSSSGVSASPRPEQSSKAPPSVSAAKVTTKKNMPPPAPKSTSKASSISNATTPKSGKNEKKKPSATTTTTVPDSSSQPTPTPKPSAPATTATTTAAAKRPSLVGPNSLYQARSLKELAKLSGSNLNSPATSVAGSPATTTQDRTSFLGKAGIGQTKKPALFSNKTKNNKPSNHEEDDNDDDDSDDDDDSSSTSSSTSSSSANNQSQAKNVVRKPGVLPTRTNPAVRQASVDNDSGSESGTGSSDGS